MLILVIVFVAFFVSVVMVGSALSAGNAQEVKQTTSRLEALALPQRRVAREDTPNIRLEGRLSTVPWIDEWLRKVDFSERLKLLLYQADLHWTVGRLLLSSILLASLPAYLAYFRTGVFFFAIVAAVFIGAGPFIYVFRKRHARFEQMRQALPEALDLMTAAIRAGHSFSSAMSMVAKDSPEPVRREFRQCFDEQNYGLEFRVALSNLQYRVPTGEIGMLVTAVLIQAESGGNLTEILEKVAYLIRENFRLRRQIRIHTAQGRISGWILSFMPMVLGFILYLINPEQMSLLWTHPIGRKLMFTSLVMTAVGGLIIRKIVRVRV